MKAIHDFFPKCLSLHFSYKGHRNIREEEHGVNSRPCASLINQSRIGPAIGGSALNDNSPFLQTFFLLFVLDPENIHILLFTWNQLT